MLMEVLVILSSEMDCGDATDEIYELLRRRSHGELELQALNRV